MSHSRTRQHYVSNRAAEPEPAQPTRLARPDALHRQQTVRRLRTQPIAHQRVEQPQLCIARRHCLPKDPDGKLDIAHYASFWLNNPDGSATKAVQHLCWDGCMFDNKVMEDPQTWNDILEAMLSVRAAHGWS